MTNRSAARDGVVRVEVFLGGAPLLEPKIAEGLLEFGLHHPQWRFSMRGPDFRYTRDWLRAQSVSGVLVLIDDKGMARTLNAAGIPWVHLLPGRSVRQPCINVDDRSIGRLGAEFFLGKGFLRCAFCGVGTPWSGQRARGFRARLKESGRDCEIIDIPFSQDRDWGLASGSLKRLRKWVASLERGTAVMAAHDALANRVVDLCVQEGLRVPQDCAVLGVGNHELLCAAEMLETMIGGGTPPSAPLIPPQGVVERRSTEILVYGDDLVGRVVAHIREHAGDKIAVGDLLKTFPVSRRTLTRRFAAFVGHSPAAEIRQARLRQARQLVAGSRLSVTEIAAACGYADLPHMNRAFQKAYGDSPGAIRARG